MTQEELDTLMARTDIKTIVEGMIFDDIDTQSNPLKEPKLGQSTATMSVLNTLMISMEQRVQESLQRINTHQVFFKTLISKFPNIKQFQTAFEDNQSIKQSLESIAQDMQMAEKEAVEIAQLLHTQEQNQGHIDMAIEALQTAYKALEAVGKK